MLALASATRGDSGNPTVSADRHDEQPTQGLPTADRDDAGDDPLDGISFLQPSSNPKALGRLNNYDVLGVLGRGGMGVVLKAFDTSLHRTVAIKVLSPQIATSKASRRRFLREARAAAAINHPNVVVIHAAEEQDGMPFLVMECVSGRTLRERVKQQPGFDLASVLRIGTQIAAGLAAAHQQGVVHRDIKPTNIMLEDGIERVKITDFGLALVALDASQLTTARRVVGTPSYMSPEQVRGERVGPRSDLFSLGCVLWFLVVGRSPFHGAHALDVARKVEEQTLPPLTDLNPQAPPELAAIVARLLAKNAADRFASAVEVRDLLQTYLVKVSQGDSASLILPPLPRQQAKQRAWP
jgi:serine/threonine-protein kinase